MKYKLILSLLTISTIVLCVGFVNTYASPYGIGIYNAAVPYGSETSLSITAGSGVSLALSPSPTGSTSSAVNPVVVYSNDVVGYKLYVRALTTTNMVKGANTIPTSANSTPGALALNTWGINTNASSNYVGVSLSDLLLKSATGPYSAGDTTNVTYGLNLDRSKPAGTYTLNLMYTAVPQTP
jgi:hypothetical protein